MSSISNNVLKKNNIKGIKPKRKSIPININTNPTPDKFLISNHANNIASSYLSMGRRFQINKNIKASKVIHVNTNSASNYYTLNSKDTKQTNGSITSSILNSLKNNNRSEINSININNYININNNNYSLPQNSEIKRVNIVNSKEKNKLTNLSNPKISNVALINGYQNSKNNNLNNSKFKNKINNNKSNLYNLSKNKEVHSTRQNYLDSREKTKKIPMKSKIRQCKFQYKNNKPISTSFNNVYSSKRHFQGSYQREIFNYARDDLLSNLNNGKNFENNLLNRHTNSNLINSKNLYEIKNKHNRNNTASFGNKDIMNIFHKKALSTKFNNNTNNINNNINVINDENININKLKNQVNNDINNESNSINRKNIIHKINNSNNSRKQIKKLTSNAKINDIRVLINERKLNSKDIKNNINNNINKTNNHKFYYSKYLSNNYHTNNNFNMPIQNTNSTNVNINITGVKKIMVKQKDTKKINLNQNKISGKPIPTPCQKVKCNIIPSQRNIKINLAKFLQGTKTKQNNRTKVILGRKSYSIKKASKENNSDFSLSQLNDKFSNKLLKNNEEEKNQNNYNIINNKISYKIVNEKKVKIKEIKENIENKNNLKDDNSNNKNENKGSNIPHDLIKELTQHNNKNANCKNYIDLNCNSNNSTNNNIYLGNNKNDYSIDNIPDSLNPLNPIAKINPQRKKSIENGLQNMTDININLNTKNENEKKDDNKFEIINAEQIIDKEVKEDKKEEILVKEKENKYSNNLKIKNNSVINNNEIKNNLFDEENLEELPEDYDENFNDLYSIINKINFGSVLVCVEGLFTPEGRTYKKYKDKFDKFYDKLYSKKGNSFANSNSKQKKIVEVGGLTSNAKTNSSSSKKNIVSPNMMYNDLNIVKELNVNC